MRKSLPACLTLALLLPVLTFAADDKPLRPINVPVNTAGDEDEPHVADAGQTLYFSSIEKGKEVVRLSRRKGAVPWPSKTTLMDDYVANKGDIRGVYATQGKYP